MKEHFILFAGSILCFGLSSAKDRPVNVLFISADDMKPLMGCYGDPVAITPNIDNFAAGATIFKRAYCQQPVSGPSRASFLTGRYPDQTGVLRLSDWVRAKDPDIVTLPQALREAGYTTAGVGKVFQTDRNNLDSLSWSIRPQLFDMKRSDQYILEENKTDYKSVSHEFTNAPDSCYYDVKIRNAAIRTLKELASEGNPFFLAVGFHKPHLPYNAPERYYRMYASSGFNIDSARVVDAPEIAYRPNREITEYNDIPSIGPISSEQQEELKRAYYAAASFTDDNVGAVLDALKELGLYDNTMIVFLGDHGYHLGEQGLWCKSTNFEQACNAPLIIKMPGQKKTHTFEGVTEFVNIFPTVCKTCGVPVPEKVMGHNILRRSLFRKYYAFSQIPHNLKVEGKNQKFMGYSVRDKRWTYVEWFDKNGKPSFCELYDMDGRRVEDINIATSHGRKVRRMSKVLHKHLEKIGVE